MLELKKFAVVINDHPFTKPISLRLNKGDLLAVTGPNGSGKSTLLKGLLGLLETKGKLIYEDSAVDRLPASAVGYVPQRFNFQGTLPLTVKEFLDLSAVSFPDQEVCRELKINQLLNKSLAVLSGGELQRVVLARALARHPELLILDEASAGIDAMGRSAITDMLYHLNHEHGLTIITVTHDQAELAEYKKKLKGRFNELILAPHPA
ncbi:ATP-binding cassette domain-containing protein [Candidatus Berkelbacteria bacterium]|nr:ATP-binding cassette domain-containing protein [Candidatus Berkelbacteria bacterium]